MTDTEAPPPREKPALNRSMSTRASFKKKFVSGHAVPGFDQTMLVYHGACCGLFFLLAIVPPIIRWDDDRGFHASLIWAVVFLFGALFFVCEFHVSANQFG